MSGSEDFDFGFDRQDTVVRSLGGDQPCQACGNPVHEHDKEKVFPEKGPSGSWHWIYQCPE